MRHRSIVHSSIAVVLLGLLMVGSSLATNARLAAPLAAEQSLVGSWRAVATPDQGPPLLSLGTAGADGTLVVSLPPVQPVPNVPGGVLYRSSGHGAWEATGADTAIASFVASLTDGSGNPAGTATVRVEITLGADGQTWSGTNEVTMADPAGNVVATMSATVEATRIVAEAPELSSPATPNA